MVNDANSLDKASAATGRVIVIPRNGYANRLQAWASAHILARRLDWDLKVLWESQSVATTPPEWLFGDSLLRDSFIPRSEVDNLLGCPHESLPRYFNTLADKNLIVLAGHDKGEQFFMPQLSATLSRGSGPSTLLIIAGGSFWLPDEIKVLERRRDFYQSVQWSQMVDARVAEATNARDSFVALHVRETDRSREAPTKHQIRNGLLEVAEATPERALFICADTQHARRFWTEKASDLGFNSWTVDSVDFDRSSIENGVSAIVDWRLLSMAKHVVYPATSTFSFEAVVAGDTQKSSIPLSAGRASSCARQFASFIKSGVARITRG